MLTDEHPQYASLKVHLQTQNVFSDTCLLGPPLLKPIQQVKVAEGRALVSLAAHHGGSWHLKKTWGSNREIDERVPERDKRKSAGEFIWFVARKVPP